MNDPWNATDCSAREGWAPAAGLEIGGLALGMAGGATALVGLVGLAWKLCHPEPNDLEVLADGLVVLAGLLMEKAGEGLEVLAVRLGGPRPQRAFDEWRAGGEPAGEGAAQASRAAGDKDDVYLICGLRAGSAIQADRDRYLRVAAAVAARGGTMVVVEVLDAIQPVLRAARWVAGVLRGCSSSSRNEMPGGRRPAHPGEFGGSEGWYRRLSAREDAGKEGGSESQEPRVRRSR